MSQKKVKLAIIGLGNMGSAHLNTVNNMPSMDVVAVCDNDPKRLEGITEKYEIPTFECHKELLASGIAEAILICTPHYDHTSIGIDVLNAGIHVIVEKPISVHKNDCEKLIAAHTNKDQVFAAMFNQRTNPHYIKLKAMLEKGELGELRRVNWIITDWFRTAQYYKSGGWRATWSGEGGGVLMNQCPHQLDLMTWLFGVPSSVRADVNFGKYHDIEVEDDVTAFLTYPCDATGVFITTTGEAPGTNRLEVVGTQGKVVIEGSDGIKFIRNEEDSQVFCDTTDQGFATPSIWNVDIPVRGSGKQHLGILENFADVILNGADLIAPAEEGINSVELANAMIYSGLKNETVSFPIDGDAYEAMLKGLIANSTHVKETVETKVADLANTY